MKIVYHTVVEGDTLQEIGHKFNVKWQELVADNHIEDIQNLKVGNILKISTKDESVSEVIGKDKKLIYPTDCITVENDNRSIPATIVVPVTPGPFPAVVMNHGHGGSREENGGFARIALALAEKGILTIRMDFPGCGESIEPFTENCISNMIADSKASLNYIIDHYNVDKERLGILGYSMGGRIALTMGNEKDSPYKSMALLAPSADPGEEVMVRFSGGEEEYRRLEKEAMSDKGYADFTTVFGDIQTLGHKWFSEMKASYPLKDIKNFKGTMLVVYGDQDFVVPLAENERLLSAFPRAKKRKLEDVDHGYGFFSNEPSLTSKIEDTFASFFEKTL